MFEVSARRVDYYYFPAIVRYECDSPVDALVNACVDRSEAMNLVVASWFELDTVGLLATVDGGRQVVVMRDPGGRWLACHPYLGDLCTTLQEAEGRLQKRLRPRRRGVIAKIAINVIKAADLC